MSVSMGLIVTELVINAIKHAFPDQTSRGKINVSFAANDGDWLLSVSDTGAGMPVGKVQAKPVSAQESSRLCQSNLRRV